MISSENTMNYAKQLIDRISAAPQNERVGVLSNELLREFQRGHPLDDLELMMKSADGDIVAVAIWIASELGERCKPLLDTVTPLLRHPLQSVRFWALDCLLWTSPNDGCDLAIAVRLLNDTEVGIQRKALDLLSRLTREQLEAMARCSGPNALAQSGEQGVRWLLSSDALVSESVNDALRNSDRVLRQFAVVAAARLGKENKQPLRLASTLDDPDISRFASRLLAD